MAQSIKKIGTHNSATGETASFWSMFLNPFAKCQSKSLIEQYKAGARLFDIRVKKYNDTLYCYHGPWRTSHSAQEVLRPFINYCTEPIYIELTWEGSTPSDEDIKIVQHLADWIINNSKNATVTRINKKTPWETIVPIHPVPYVGDGIGFLGIHGFRCLLPIPWLWSKLYKHPDFNSKTFMFVDFL